ncbi:MAG TPA: hypothetical protein VGK47_06240, partial [Nitrososphaeraceae archaeon]
NGGFARHLNLFLKSIDFKGEFKNWRLNAHQFKHSLTRQMIKIKLGLPYISFHLKHLHGRVSSLPNDVTLAYGNAAKLMHTEMAGFQLDEIRRDITRKIYDPESIVQGGAAKEFDDRRKAYFQGMTNAGMSKEQIIDNISRMSFPIFVNVGLGYCTGRKDNPKTGENPPCIGSLRCNPNCCSNAIVTKEHIPAWKKVYFENRKMMNDSRFTYAKAELGAAMHEARQVLEHLGEEIEGEAVAAIR